MRTQLRHSSPAWHPVLRRILLALAAAIWLAPHDGWPQTGAGIKVAAAAPTPVYPTAPCGRVEIAPVVQVSVGKSTVIRPASPITRILLGNPEGTRAARPTESKGKGKDDRDADSGAQSEDKLRPGVAELDVLLLSPTEVYLLGKGIGSTNVVLVDKAGVCTAFDVVVNMDTGALQTVLGQLLPDEKGVRIASAFDSIVLTGSVSDAGAVTRVMDLANAYVRGSGGGAAGSVAGANPRIVNMLSTGAPQQVMLEVKVAEVSKSLIDKLGAGLTAIAEITLDRQGAEHLQAFEQRATADDAVQQCYRVSPGPDFVLLLQVADMAAWNALVERLFTQDANVRNVKTFFSVRRAKFTTQVALPGDRHTGEPPPRARHGGRYPLVRGPRAR